MTSGRHRKPLGGAPKAVGTHAAENASKRVYLDWVWWPNIPGRRSRAEEEFFKLPANVQGELLTRIKRLLTGETRFKDVDDLGDGIKELRYRVGNNHYRILFFVRESICVGVTCFYKNKQKTEKVDLDRAKNRRDQY